jgi:G3E family GTPase
VRVLCIAGFLASGKTTMLLRLARTMAEDGLRLAIVENEIGEIGVDGGYVREAGLPVRELFGGCICCTLQTGLVETLRTIEAEYDPDWVIVEPTGLAAPGDLAATVGDLMPHLPACRVLTLVDAERWEMLMAVVSPLIEAQIEAADVVAINKVDAVDHAAVEEIEAAVRRSNAAAPIVPTAAASGAGLQELREVLL